MATNLTEKNKDLKDVSGGVQTKTTQFLRKDNQVESATNVSFGPIGGIEKIEGYSQLGNTITTSSTSSSTTSSTSTSTSTSSTTSTSTSTTSTTS